MANKTIPELTEVSSPISSDLLIIHNSNLAKKIQLQNILPEVSDTDTIDLTINKTTRTISGDVKSASITNVKLADVPALSIKGRKEIDSGSAQDLTLLEVQTLLNSTGAVVDTEVRALTSNWEDTYTTVRDFSGSWGSGGSGSTVDTEVRSLTSNWEDTYTTVRDFSGSWDNTFNTTNSDTVNLAWDNSTRTLSADVIGSSLTTVLSSSLSASPLVAKAWVNFDGTTIGTSTANTSQSVSVTDGSDIGTFINSGPWTSNFIGQTYYINSIAGVSGATLGGVDVAISGIKIISASGTSATVKLLGGVATSSQTITGTGSPSTGFVFSTSGIRSSYNVSSVTKNGTGDYTMNFTTPMANANYSTSVNSVHSGSNQRWISFSNSATYLIGSVGILIVDPSVSLYDSTCINVQIFSN
jgi:hypothetical protein